MTTKTIPVGLALTAAMFFSALDVSAQARHFEVRTGPSRVTFVSEAPLETINGVSSQVSGQVTFDPNDLTTARGTVELPTASLRTGIDLRDEHLRRDTWLDADRNPTIEFEITGVTGPRTIEPNRVVRVTVRGRLTIHGRTREITVPAQVKLIPVNDQIRGQAGNIDGDVLRIRASFPVKLEDYGVSVPAIVQLKVAAQMTVDVNITAVARPAS